MNLLAAGPGEPYNPTGCRRAPKDHVDFNFFSIFQIHPHIYLYAYHSMPLSPITWTPDHFLSGLPLLFHGILVHTVLQMIFAKCKSNHVTAHCLYLPTPKYSVQWLPIDMKASRKDFNLDFVYTLHDLAPTDLLVLTPVFRASLTLPSQGHPFLMPLTRSDCRISIPHFLSPQLCCSFTLIYVIASFVCTFPQ